MTRTVGIVGVGNMGTALARGFLRSDQGPALVLYDRDADRTAALAEDHPEVEITQGAETLASRADVVVIAVKPQSVDGVLSAVSDAVGAETVVLSTAAGVTLERLRVAVGPEPRLFRMMPNLAVALGAGVVALSGEGGAEEAVLDDVRDLLSVLGAVAVVPEGQFNAVTAVAASGPGLLAVMLEAFEDGAVSVGLSRGVSRLFVQQMALGTARMLLEGEEAPSQLKDRVCSPAGTTVAGVAELEDAGIRGAIIRAIQAAESRGRQL